MRPKMQPMVQTVRPPIADMRGNIQWDTHRPHQGLCTLLDWNKFAAERFSKAAGILPRTLLLLRGV